MLVVHSRWLAREIHDDQPDACVDVVEMGVPAPVAGVNDGQEVRARHGVPVGAVVFAAFGELTPEKRIAQALRAVASIAAAGRDIHLMLVGRPVGHYDAMGEARALGVAEHVTMAGFVPQEQLASYLAAADVCLCMRWPSSRETSAAWLRCVAAGRPTIVTDLVHMVDVPAIDPRGWTTLGAPAPEPGRASVAPAEPACVSIDILDEEHSLGLAMRRLAGDARLRVTLGRNALELWRRRFTLDRMVSGYRAALETARAKSLPDPAGRHLLPAHFLTDGTERIRTLLGHLGIPEISNERLWQPTGPGSRTAQPRS